MGCKRDWANRITYLSFRLTNNTSFNTENEKEEKRNEKGWLGRFHSVVYECNGHLVM